MDRPLASILVPNRNGSKTIGKCIYSILENKCNFGIEILVIDGGSKDDSLEIILGIVANDPRVRLIRNPNQTVPWAVNLGFKEAMGDYIFLASSHSEFAPDYINKLIELCKTSGADCVGAIGKIRPRKGGSVAEAIALVLSNKFGVGNALYRLGVKEIRSVDTVAYGCYKRETIEKYGLFDTRLVRNQDIEYNKRIKNNGGKILLTPETWFIYYARDNYRDLAKNNFENGMWSVITPSILNNLNTQSLRHYVPVIFLMSIVLPAIAGIFYPKVFFASAFVLCLYAIVLAIESARLSIQNDEVNIFNVIIAFIVLHFSYGIGSMYGVLKIVTSSVKRAFKGNVNE